MTSHDNRRPAVLRRLVGVLAALALAFGWTVASTPAQAKAGVWDRVAKCESGNRWNINTGNGYYGGLQFSRSTWKAYGGGKYASTANRATKAEQIAIARRVLAGQGPGAWPTCSKRAGLTKANGKANRKATPASNPGSGSSEKAKKSSVKKSSSDATTTNKKFARVKRGDTLGKLAKRYGVRGGWRALYRMNKSRLDSPHVLSIGQKLKVRA